MPMPATINIYNFYKTYKYLYSDIPREISSCFIVSDFAQASPDYSRLFNTPQA